MATDFIPLVVGAHNTPDGSASNAAPALQRVKTSAAAPTPHSLQLAFDATTREMVDWGWYDVPLNYASSPVLKAKMAMASATTGNVVLEGRVAAITAGDATDKDAKAFAAANTSSATAVPGTAGYVFEVSVALTNNDSMAAGDIALFYLARDTGAADTATGDWELQSAKIEYTTT